MTMAGMANPRHARLARLSAAITRNPLADNPLLLGVAGIGFSLSFQTIAREAVAHHLPGWAPLYPVGIDVGILALILEARKLIKRHRSDLVPRVMAWLLSLGTIYVNVHGSPPHDWLGRAMHAIMPALWIVFLELTRWRQRADIRKAEKADPVPLARWLLSPVHTARLKKRMADHNVLSYKLASALEDARLHMRDLARAHYGGRWGCWRKAPSLLRMNIRRGRVGDDVTAAVAEAVRAGRSGGWEAVVRQAVTRAITDGDKLTADVAQERRAIRHATDDASRSATTAPAGTPGGASLAAPAPRQEPRQRSPQMGATERDAAHAKARRLLTRNPGIKIGDVAEQTGLSPRTVDRIKATLPALRSVAGD